MENTIEKLIAELAQTSNESKEGAKKALDIIRGYLIIAGQVSDKIKVSDVKDLIGRIQGEL